MKLILMADSHLMHLRGDGIEVPNGDLLIHAGDMTWRGNPREIRVFNDWFSALPHRHKVVIPGNHDWDFQTNYDRSMAILDPSIHLLKDREVEIGGLRIYGSPWTPEFFNWAFMAKRGQDILEKWMAIPDGVDVVVTHGPPKGIGDMTARSERAGCQDLKDELLNRVRPRLHVFGHIHNGHGVYEKDDIKFVNASVVNDEYKVVFTPVEVEM